MKHKKTQLWLIGIGVGLIMVVTITAFTANNYSLYKGDNTFKAQHVQTSVLNDFSQRTKFPLRVDKVQRAEPSETVEAPRAETPPVVEPEPFKESTGCAADEVSVIRGGNIECKKQTCEDEGKVTYLGEDKPGLLYGMCIEK